MNPGASWWDEALRHVLLLLGAVVVLLPFYLMLSYSLKSPAEIESNTGGSPGPRP